MFECKKCGKDSVVYETGYQLMSSPPKYSGECTNPECGEMYRILVHEYQKLKESNNA